MGTPFKVKLAVISHSRFMAECDYNANVIGVFKTIESRKYNPATKTWDFDLKDHGKLVSSLRLLPIKLQLQEIPSKVLEVLTDIGSSKRSTQHLSDISKIEKRIFDNLMPFQKEGVFFTIRHNGRAIIADDMGLGKTLQAIAIASYYREEWPLLVICPSSMRMTWSQAILRWLSAVDETDINVVLKGSEDPCSGIVNILSYDLMTKMKDEIKGKQPQVIISDESHYLKNFKAARTKALLPILKVLAENLHNILFSFSILAARRVILLSGTPALSRPEELFTQINAVNSKLYSSFVPFAHRYCDAKQTPFGLDSSGSSNLEELKIVLEHKIMIRRLKCDVMNQLPEKLRHVVTLDPSLINIKQLEEHHKSISKASTKERRGVLLEYFHATGQAKLRAVSGYIEDIIEKKNKFLLFGHHQVVLDTLSELLQRKSIQFVRIDGSTSAKDRHRFVQTFQEDSHCQVAVLSILAANLGLTLTAASTVVFAELYWNPGALIQAEDRAFRIGQRNAVTVVYLMAKRTADDYIWPLVQEKLHVLANAGLSQGSQLDAEVSTFRDPKQRKILDFFQDFACDDASETVCDKQQNPESPNKRHRTQFSNQDYKDSPQCRLKDFWPPAETASFNKQCAETDVETHRSAGSSPREAGKAPSSLRPLEGCQGNLGNDVDLLEGDDDVDALLLSMDYSSVPPKRVKY